MSKKLPQDKAIISLNNIADITEQFIEKFNSSFLLVLVVLNLVFLVFILVLTVLLLFGLLVFQLFS